MFRAAIFLLFALATAASSAEDYYWQDRATLAVGDTFTGLYELRKPEFESDWPPPAVITFNGCVYTNTAKSRVACEVFIDRPDGLSDITTNVIIWRYGSSCPNPDDVYNEETGGCEEPNRCSDTEGVTTLHMFQRATRANAYDPWPETGDPRPVTVCKDECRYSASGYTGEDTCGALIKDPLIQACITPYIGQGIPCVHGDADHQSQLPSFDPGENPQPDPPTDPEDPTDPAVLCNKTPGFVWSGSVCTPIFSEDSPEPNPDQPNPGTPGGGGEGSGDGGEGDGGEGGGGEGGGTGTGGTGSGGGGGSQSENPNNVLGTECDQALQCTADAYQCAILYQTKRSRCDMEKALDFEEQRPQIEALFTGEDFQMDEEEIDIPSFIGQGARFLPATCPAPISIPLSGKTFQLQMEPFCTFASDLGFLIVAFATLASALYIGRAFGGE